MSEQTLAGGCLCGGIRFRIHRPVRDVWVCHCSQCRRTSGHYWATTAVALERFELTELKTLRWFRSSATARRGFCHSCGASLFWHKNDSEQMNVSAGSIDGTTGLLTERHIYLDDAGVYYQIHPQELLTTGTEMDDN